jgi:hypothetical protein
MLIEWTLWQEAKIEAHRVRLRLISFLCREFAVWLLWLLAWPRVKERFQCLECAGALMRYRGWAMATGRRPHVCFRCQSGVDAGCGWS